MTYQQFQQQYEAEADKEYEALNRFSESELLTLIADKNENKYKIWQGDSFGIWHVLGDKGTNKSIPVLFEIVTNLQINYLVRYHACNALFNIAKIVLEGLKGEVQYGLDINREPVDQQKAFKRLEDLLKDYLV